MKYDKSSLVSVRLCHVLWCTMWWNIMIMNHHYLYARHHYHLLTFTSKLITLFADSKIYCWLHFRNSLKLNTKYEQIFINITLQLNINLVLEAWRQRRFCSRANAYCTLIQNIRKRGQNLQPSPTDCQRCSRAPPSGSCRGTGRTWCPSPCRTSPRWHRKCSAGPPAAVHYKHKVALIMSSCHHVFCHCRQ